MNSQKLTVLAVVAAVMVIWAVSLSRRDLPVAATGEATHLIQGLDPAQIGSIEIGKGDDKVVLRRAGKQFVAPAKENYPASAKQISELITKCFDIRTSELYASGADSHADLGVTEEEAQTLVRFSKADGSPLTGIIVGKSRGEGARGSFVRRLDSNDVYVTPSAPYVATGVTSYLDQEILALDKANITSVTVTDPNGTAYTLATDANDPETILMPDLPAGRKLATNTARSVLTALTSLRFDDVSRTADPNATFDWTYVAKLKDATVYTLRIAVAGDDKSYVQVAAAYEDKVLIDPAKQDDEAALKEKEAKLKTQEQALAFTAKHKGWIYTIPHWKSQYLVKYLDELLEALPDPVPADVNAPPADPNASPVLQAAPSDLQEAMQGVGSVPTPSQDAP